MTEIFEDISDEVKLGAELVFNAAVQSHDPIKMVQMLNDYTDNCATDYERSFVQFYFNMRMEQIYNESNDNQR